MTRFAHLRGGPGDGKLILDPRAGATMSYAVPPQLPAGGWASAGANDTLVRFETVTYHRRGRDLHPPTFVRRTGGPDQGHWLYDIEGRHPETFSGAILLPRQLAHVPRPWDFLARQAIQFLACVDQDAAATGLNVDYRDVEWDIRHGTLPGDVFLVAEVVAQ